MDDVEEQILSYPHLPAEEQRRIEDFVESNPQWAPLLRDVRSLENLAGEAQEALPSNALLATYVVVQHLYPEGGRELPPSLHEVFAELEAEIEEDEALRREVTAAHRRLTEAEAAIDPASHFEALTGHALETEAETGTVGEADSEEAREKAPSMVEVFLNLPLFVRRIAVAAVLLGGVYAGLYGVSVATQSPAERLAAVDISDQLIEGYADAKTRSIVSESDTLAVDELYLEALSTLRTARRTSLGLFPRYDAEKIARAERLLTRVLDRVDPGSFLALEARYYLGKTALAQGNVDTAQEHFKTVVKRQGQKREEAYEILKTLQQEQVDRNE